MESMEGALHDRVDELMRSFEGGEPVLSTIGTRALVEVLVARTEGLERAVRELAFEIEKLAGARQS